jgi:hypothetical protein
MKKLKRSLEKAHDEYLNDPFRRIGMLNDKVLAGIVKDIRKNPSLDNFIMFTNCLNYFYSTRLQAAVDRDSIALKNSSRVIIRVAKELLKAWDEEGLNLKEEISYGPINVRKVERLRTRLKKVLGGRAAYSFCTKVFHQLNSQYPILDIRIYRFMDKRGFRDKVNFYKKENSYKIFYSKFIDMVVALEWSQDEINELDNAIWVYYDKRKAGYEPKRKANPAAA